jgi:hypothetical protein
LTCRRRKIKCDEIHPVCTNCTIHRFSCDWLTSNRKAVPRSADSSESPQLAEPLQRWGARARSSQSEHDAAHPNPIIAPTPSLWQSQMQCSNSLTLPPQDRRLWDFFPSTTFFLYYDFGDCSVFRYLVRELARSSSVVMSMMLATSASEMRKRGLHPSWDQSSHPRDCGLYYYNIALNHLHSRVACYASAQSEPHVELLVASIFFMVNYEIQFPTLASVKRIKMHLEGLWTVISTHPLFQNLDQDVTMAKRAQNRTAAANLSLSCQLIVWCLSVTHIVEIEPLRRTNWCRCVDTLTPQ